MHQNTFVRLALAAFGLVIVSFMIRGFGSIFVSTQTAQLLSAPTMLVAGVVIVFLTIRSVLAVSGIRPLER